MINLRLILIIIIHYYKAHLLTGGKTKKKQFNRTIFVQVKEKNSVGALLDIVKKISFARLQSAKRITREEYIAGVSASRG